MNNKYLLFIIGILILFPLLLFAQEQLENKKSVIQESHVIIDKNRHEIISIRNLKESSSDNKSRKLFKPYESQTWVAIMTEDFEGNFPGSGWDVHAQTDYADAYWGKMNDNSNYVAWCAASGSKASTWNLGYPDSMRAWMEYGPFDLSDASDAYFDFYYVSDCEPGYDTFGWYASLDGIHYHGYYFDTTSNLQWQEMYFDLTSVPTIGDLTGESVVYVAFLFTSDETNLGEIYHGAKVDDISLWKNTTTTYPTYFPINTTFSYSDITQSSSYRMVGLPGNLNRPLSQLVTGTRKTDWNAYYDNGAASNYLIEYDGSTNFNFKPGNGFWLLSKNAVTVNEQVNSVAIAGDNTYSISLHSGWNIISNPFERSTNWSGVQFTNLLGSNALIYDWNGSWATASLFSPYKAYYFNNVNNQTSLSIPYDPSGILGKASDEKTLRITGENDIKLALLSNREEKSKAFIGFESESRNDFDIHDYFAPPGDFEEARIVLRNDNLSTDYKFLMKESRAEIGDGQIYYLDVKNLTGQELTFKIEGLSNYNNYQAYLIDERLNNEIKVTENSELIVPSNVENNSYRFLIGTQQFIETNKGNLTPTQFVLYQNYPNPFNPATIIRYSVPSVSVVNIKLYDLLGNELKTLLSEEKALGNYEFEFNAADLASGVYIYKMQAGSFAESKKMIVLR
jgi:hypothetical protein